jgi:transcriptional regulator with XRE-family HTH domain
MASQVERAFGMTIRRRRHGLKLSQEDFAEKADVHRTYISSVELGKVSVGIGIAYKLARALGTPLSRLLQEAERELGARR